jgi:hypothetical protein
MGKKLAYTKKKNHCLSKRKYNTEVYAEYMAQRMGNKYFEKFYVYKCKYCKKWHIGRDHRIKSHG